jgi:hypothetical protein
MAINESENLNILLQSAELKQESVLSNIRSLDIKASIILAFFGVLFIPSVDIFQWTIRKNELIYLKFSPGISIIIGIIFCLLALFPQKIVSFPYLSILKDIYHKGINPNQLKAELFSYYEMACMKNRKLSRKKLIFINIAFIFLIISLIIIILFFIFKGEIDV